MNESDLMTAVRDRFAPVRMGTPADVIMARGRSVRRRAHGGRLAAAGVLAASLGAGLGIPAVTAGTTNAGVTHATLAAWTVQKHDDGSIGVVIREPRNLPALERRLARLGVPVLIRTGPAACLPPRIAVVPARIITSERSGRGITFEIRPVAIPARKGILIILRPAGKWKPPAAVRPAPAPALPAAGRPTVVFIPRDGAFPVARPVFKCLS
jgi:hypothetical protein